MIPVFGRNLDPLKLKLKSFSLFSSLVFVFVSLCTQAQLLAVTPSTTLNEQLLTRWMKTNVEIRSYAAVINEMFPTENEAKAFDQLNAQDQDRLVNQYLQKKGLFEPLNTNIKKLGWTGVADYMRASSRIGNAIAAYFFQDKIKRLTEEQKKAVREKEDPAVLAVNANDIEFIRTHEKILQQHISQYSK